MNKGKSITLLSIISVLMACVLVFTFIRFEVGVKNYNSLLGAVQLDYDLEGGVAYTLTLADDNEEEVGDNINAVIDTLEYRLDQLGYGAYSVKAIKDLDNGVEDYQIRIETKSTDTIQSDISVITAFGKLKFFGGTESDPTTEILKDVKVIESAKYNGEATTGQYEIAVKFTKDGYDALMALVDAESSTYYLKVTLGESVILPGLSIEEANINKRVMNLYGQSEAGARQVALQINSGGLAYKYDVSKAVEVSSPYGEDVALKCAVAIISLALVLMIAMFVAYKGFGWIIVLSSLLFLLAEGWLLIGVPGIIVSMGGIVGIISAIVLNAVGMIILGKRVKEEFANSEKTAKAAVAKGFSEALVPTINVNVIAGLFALALLVFAKGIIKSFALTFGIGAVVALISTLVFTRMFNALIFPLVKNKETFLGKKQDVKKAGVAEEA